MGYKEKLQVVLDVDGNGAASGLRGFIGNFRSAVGQAEGMAGKFKAGVGAMGQSLTAFATSGAGMVAIGGAIGTALGKAVGAAQDLALQVGRLSDQTGLSNEQASRWIEITGDMGISSETLAGLLGKLTQNLGKSPEQFKALGVEIKHTADGTVDMNATLLNAIQVIDSMQDPTKRAELAAKLFGKGWKEASELIGMGADKVKAKLDAVGDAKIKTGQNVKDARDFRDSMEDLKDVTSDMAQTIGTQLIPALTSAAKGLKGLADIGATELPGGMKVSDGVLGTFTETLHLASDAVTGLDDSIGGMDPRWVQFQRAMGEATGGAGQMTDATDKARDAMFGANTAIGGVRDVTNESVGSMRAMEAAERDAAYEAAQLAQDAAEATQRIKDLHDELSGDKSLQELKVHLRDNAARLKDLAAAYDKTNKTAEDNARYMEEVAIITDDSKLSVLEYVTALGTVPAEVATDILTNMDPNNVQATIDKVQDIASRANLHMDITVGAIADSTLRNLLEGRGTGTPTGLPGTPSAPPSGDPVTPSRGGSGSQQGLGGPHRGGGGDVYLQLDRQTLVVFKNALDDLSRGTR